MDGHALRLRRAGLASCVPVAVDDARRHDLDLVAGRAALARSARSPSRSVRRRRAAGQYAGDANRMRRRSLTRWTLARSRRGLQSVRLALPPVSSGNGTSSRPRLLVLNQYYWPGVEATANLLTELCEALADDYDVTVIAGATPGGAGRREVRNGVGIVRVRSTSYDRTQLSRRAANYFDVPRGLGARGARRSTGPTSSWHDRPAVHRRCGRARRASIPGAAPRDQPGRLPGDRRRGSASREPAPRSACSSSSFASTSARRPRGRDRRDDAQRVSSERARRRIASA